MRKNILYFVALAGFLFFGCESPAPSPSSTKQTEKTEESKTTTPAAVIKAPDCAILHQVMEGNKIWFPAKKVYAAIIPDSTAADDESGQVDRTFIILDKACNITFKEALPKNDRPDYGYFLAPINYNQTSQIVGIKGFDAVFIFDLNQQKLYPKLTPDFLNERLGEDAQSGQIKRLEVWENYLIGYAQDYGTFVFDLKEKSNPKALLPIAEYIVDDAVFYSVFALPTKGEESQLIIPSFDFENDKFDINPLLKEPLSLDLNLAKNVRNNKVILLREKNEAKTPLVIDLKKRKLIALPESIKQKKTSEILKWVKSRR